MAAGDLTLNTPKVVTVGGLVLSEILVRAAEMIITFNETSSGAAHVVILRDSGCIGVDYAGGVLTDGVPRAIAGEFSKMLGLLFKAGAKTTLTSTLIADGVTTVAGTVG